MGKVFWSTCLYVCCLTVCLCVWPLAYLKKHTSKFHYNFCGVLPILLCRLCNKLYTSAFVDDVMFSHNGANAPKSSTTLYFVDIAKWLGTAEKSDVYDCLVLRTQFDPNCYHVVNNLIWVWGMTVPWSLDADLYIWRHPGQQTSQLPTTSRPTQRENWTEQTWYIHLYSPKR